MHTSPSHETRSLVFNHPWKEMIKINPNLIEIRVPYRILMGSILLVIKSIPYRSRIGVLTLLILNYHAKPLKWSKQSCLRWEVHTNHIMSIGTKTTIFCLLWGIFECNQLLQAQVGKMVDKWTQGQVARTNNQWLEHFKASVIFLSSLCSQINPCVYNP